MRRLPIWRQWRRVPAPPSTPPERRPVDSRQSGHPPDAVSERTNLGAVADRRVAEAHLRVRLGVDPDYDLVYEHFDVLHYLLQVPRLWDRPEVDLVKHFLERGVAELRSPHPDFSMSTYLRRHPELAEGPERSPYLHWLKRGRSAGEIADPVPRPARMARVLGLGRDELIELAAGRRRDLQSRLRTGRLGEVFARAAEIEPLIGQAWTELADPKLLPLSTQGAADQQYVLFRAQEAAGFRRARLVLVINRSRWGGGKRLEGHLTHALTDRLEPADVVVIHTDGEGHDVPDRYPDGVRIVEFARLAKDLPSEQAQRCLVLLLRSFQAEAIVNINSRLLYHAMRPYGRALAASERVFLVFFCNEQTGVGSWQGWSLRYFYRLFPQVAGVITDSSQLAEEIVTRYRVDDEGRRKMTFSERRLTRHFRLSASRPRVPGGGRRSSGPVAGTAKSAWICSSTWLGPVPT